MSERDELLRELAETARFLGSLSRLGVTSPPQGIAGPPQGIAGPPQGMAGPPQGMAGPPQGMAGPPQGMAGPPQGMAGEEAASASAPANAEAGAPSVASGSLLGGEDVVAAAPRGVAPSAGAGAVPGLAAAGEGEAGLRAIREELGDCQRCRLSQGRKTIVFGQGNPNAELMFVGEAPGAEEDQQGLAFVGRAGQLLTDIIEKGLKMTRADVYITNCLKCRPPQNRNPEPDEILSCQPFLEAQIRAIRPRVLVGLGKFGAHWLLKTAEPITRLRGRLGEYEGIPVMPTYHPAYLLRNPSAKKDVWEDMKVVLQILGRPVPR